MRILELAPRSDPRGSSFPVALPFTTAHECHVATLRPGHVRGNHFHREGRELLVVVHRDAWSLWWDDGEGTPVQSRTFAGAGAVQIEAEPLCAHAIRNDGGEELQLFVLGDAVRSPDTFPRKVVEPLTKLAGVDGCRDGWIAVLQCGSGLETRVLVHDDELLALFRECAVVGIDVPIGLVEKGARACDHHARRMLRTTSSVFTAPIRPILEAPTPEEAQRIARSLQNGKGLQYTTVALRQAVAQIDRILQRHHDVRHRVVEVHPEISFVVWNEAPLPPKKIAAGLDERRRLVTARFGELPPVPRGAREHDLLDAFAALWTAERFYSGKASTLGDAHVDVTGLPMRIVY